MNDWSLSRDKSASDLDQQPVYKGRPRWFTDGSDGQSLELNAELFAVKLESDQRFALLPHNSTPERRIQYLEGMYDFDFRQVTEVPETEEELETMHQVTEKLASIVKSSYCTETVVEGILWILKEWPRKEEIWFITWFLCYTRWKPERMGQFLNQYLHAKYDDKKSGGGLCPYHAIMYCKAAMNMMRNQDDQMVLFSSLHITILRRGKNHPVGQYVEYPAMGRT